MRWQEYNEKSIIVADNYRKIIHVDMDAFFASVEQHDDPSLQGKPIAIGYDGKRGVVSTASYEARPFGVHSAMPIATAKRLCPQLIIVPSHFERYKEISALVHGVFHEYTDIIEPISLDEAFLDVTNNKKGIELAQDVAREIKARIKEATGLTASAGISYNKLLAKIASDWRKPDGMFTIHPDRAADFIANLKVEKLWGVGPKTTEKMHMMGIFTGADLRAVSLPRLTGAFGKAGRLFYDFARGIDNRPVVTERIRKSVGCEETFLDDISEESLLTEELEKLAKELKRRVDHRNFQGYTLTLKAKFADFAQVTRSITLETPINEETEMLAHGKSLLKQVDYNREHPIRLLGLSVNNPLLSESDHYSGEYIQLEFDFEWDD